MKHLLHATLLGCLSMALLCAGASLLGQRNPKPEIIPGLAMCNDLPCYMGITLNTTTWEEAKQIFENTPDFSLSSFFQGAEVANGAVRNVITFSSDQSIFEIDLIFREGELPFYRVLADLGTPCGVHSIDDPNYLAISFRDRLVWVMVDKFKIRPTSSVVEMYLGPTTSPAPLTPERQQLRCRRSGDGSESPKYSWQGYHQYP
jgi:hypothetical protein